MCAPLANNDPPHQDPAVRAGFTRALVDLEVVLVGPAAVHPIDALREPGAKEAPKRLTRWSCCPAPLACNSPYPRFWHFEQK